MTSVMTPLTTAQIFSTFKTDYCGNIIYENGNVSRILTEEGYITFNGTTPVYHYYLKDHQGNNRVVLNRNGTVEQVNHYYPLDGLFGEGTGGGVQPYRYNGKELDRMHGLDLFDYGARHYDATLGRWWTPDPLAEKYYGISPYAYVANSPVRFIDPNGMFYHDYTIDRDGYIKKERHTQDKYDMLYTKKDYDSGKTDKGLKLDKEAANSRTMLADLEERSISLNQTNSSTALKVFKYVADNSDVEWAFSRYSLNKSTQYGIWTSHNPHSVDVASQVGINSEIVHIHSHPSIMNDYKKEMNSMGANWADNQGKGYFWKAPYAPVGNGVPDWQRVYQSKGNTIEAVYFPQSQKLYRLRKGEWEAPLLIRNINRVNDLRFW